MPVKSLNSCVFRWPDAGQINKAVCAWASRIAQAHPELIKLGYFGSYARNAWGVGSDLDLIAIVTQSDKPFHQRMRGWKLCDLPVPADMLIYTETEWHALLQQGGRFARTVANEAVWVYHR